MKSLTEWAAKACSVSLLPLVIRKLLHGSDQVNAGLFFVETQTAKVLSDGDPFGRLRLFAEQLELPQKRIMIRPVTVQGVPGRSYRQLIESVLHMSRAFPWTVGIWRMGGTAYLAKWQTPVEMEIETLWQSALRSHDRRQNHWSWQQTGRLFSAGKESPYWLHSWPWSEVKRMRFVRSHNTKERPRRTLTKANVPGYRSCLFFFSSDTTKYYYPYSPIPKQSCLSNAEVKPETNMSWLASCHGRCYPKLAWLWRRYLRSEADRSYPWENRGANYDESLFVPLANEDSENFCCGLLYLSVRHATTAAAVCHFPQQVLVLPFSFVYGDSTQKRSVDVAALKCCEARAVLPTTNRTQEGKCD